MNERFQLHDQKFNLITNDRINVNVNVNATVIIIKENKRVCCRFVKLNQCRKQFSLAS